MDTQEAAWWPRHVWVRRYRTLDARHVPPLLVSVDTDRVGFGRALGPSGAALFERRDRDRHLAALAMGWTLGDVLRAAHAAGVAHGNLQLDHISLRAGFWSLGGWSVGLAATPDAIAADVEGLRVALTEACAAQGGDLETSLCAEPLALLDGPRPDLDRFLARAEQVLRAAHGGALEPPAYATPTRRHRRPRCRPTPRRRAPRRSPRQPAAIPALPLPPIGPAAAAARRAHHPDARATPRRDARRPSRSAASRPRCSWPRWPACGCGRRPPSASTACPGAAARFPVDHHPQHGGGRARRRGRRGAARRRGQQRAGGRRRDAPPAAEVPDDAKVAADASPDAAQPIDAGPADASLHPMAAAAFQPTPRKRKPPRSARPVPAGTVRLGLDVRRLKNVACPEGVPCPAVPTVEQANGSVRVDAFRLDRTEVSRKAYARCVDDGACPDLKLPAGGRHRPQTHTPRAAAAAYCAWRGGRLPTFAEWQRAARGDDTRLFPWGDDPPFVPPHRRRAHVVTSKDYPLTIGRYAEFAGPYGHINLVGNVREWTADGPATAAVTAGGSFRDAPADLRVTRRATTRADRRDDDLGFRCAY
ncbi:MAG: SUMF1/EgtB/PvdO family nonheme iron enzyme [Myxococcales bacterium]|nr:SUMF1/EgtB/PvdO family nonheme iron enzyme [Myxococcales bacterium]